ncbi:MAG: hypothetical protein ABIJ65_06870 [Chloroflexota bacterium]
MPASLMSTNACTAAIPALTESRSLGGGFFHHSSKKQIYRH